MRSVRCGITGATIFVSACSFTTDLTGFASAPPAATPDGRGGPAAPPLPPASGLSRTLSIENTSTATLPAEHTVCMDVDGTTVQALLSAKSLRSDFGDLRVHGPSGERLRVVDQRGGGRLVVCFRIERPIAPGATDDGYTLRYGAPDLSPPPPAEDAVFAFFDGFDSRLSSDYEVRGTPIVQDGALHLPAGTNEPGIATRAATDAVPIAASFEIRVRVTNPSSRGLGIGGTNLYYWFGFHGQGVENLNAAGPPYTVFYADAAGSIRPVHERQSGACADPPCTGVARVQTADFQTYRVDRTATSVRFVWDDGAPVELSGSNGDTSLLVRSFLRDGDVIVDWIRARPLISPEPTITLGP